MIPRALLARFHHIFTTNYLLDADCEGAWRFQEGSGLVTADESQNTNTGDFKGAGEPSWQSGDPPKAYQLYYPNFQDDYIDVGLDSTINFGSQSGDRWSHTSWIRVESLAPSWQVIICRRDSGGSQGYIWGFNSAGTLFLAGVGIGTNYGGVGALASVDTWYFAAMSLSLAHDISFYIDGVLSGTPAAFASSRRTNNNTWIGRSKFGTSAPFYGDMGEQSAFSRPLDSTEINAIMDDGLEGVTSNPFPVSLINRDVQSGYHCFVSAYLSAKVAGYDPLKLPDGTIF